MAVPSPDKSHQPSTPPYEPVVPSPDMSHQSLNDPLSPSSNTNTTITSQNFVSAAPISIETNIHQGHFMVTRAKNEIFTPKIFLTEYKEIEPPIVNGALRCPH